MKKVLIITCSIIGLLLIVLLVTPLLFKDKIINAIKSEASNTLNATVNFDNDITLSLIKNFPNFTLGINKLSIVGKEEFVLDTLIAWDNLEATIDVMSVINGEQILIKKIWLNNPAINAIVLNNGKANWDITKADSSSNESTTDTTATKFKIGLKQLKIENAAITYNDRLSNVASSINGFDLDMTGDFTQDEFLLQVMSKIKSLSVAYGGIKYLNKVSTDIKLDLDMNLAKMIFKFKENHVTLNALKFNFDGSVEMPGDDIKMDVKYSANQATFKDFLSLIPIVYSKDFENIQTKGKLAFNGFAKGTYNMQSIPAFGFNLQVADAMFKYPQLPSAVNDIAINLAITNPDGNLNNTTVNLSKFHFDVDGDAFDLKLVANNVIKDPNVDASLKGRVNLNNVSKIVPLENGMELKGIITANITAVGKISDIENQRYESFNASGELALKDVLFKSNDLPQSFNLTETNISFSPKTVRVNSFDAKLGSSDFKLAGEISNFFPYLFNNGTLNGSLTLKADLLDANQFITAEPETTKQPSAEDTTSLEAPLIPGNISFVFNSTIKNLLYSNFDITNFAGNLSIANQKLNFSNISLNMLGSTIKMNGFYETTNPKNPAVELSLDIANLDIQQSFKTFNTIKKIAPIAENVNGLFSTKLQLKTLVDQHLNVVYPSLYGTGNLNIPKAEIGNVKLFNKVAEALKSEKYNKASLTNVNIEYKIENGRVHTEPFNINFSGQQMQMNGSTGLDQSIDYKGLVNIPRKDLSTINNSLETALNQLNAKAGSNIKASDLIPVGILIGGTFTAPKINTNLADLAKKEAASLANQAKDELEKQKKLLEAKAKEEATRLKKEAELKAKQEAEKIKQQGALEAEKAKKKAAEEAEKLKKEAEQKANEEKEKAKKKAAEEIKNKLKGRF